MPFHYYLVSNPRSGDLQRGFGVAQAELQSGQLRTRSGRVLPMESVEEARPVRALATDHLGLAWVI